MDDNSISRMYLIFFIAHQCVEIIRFVAKDGRYIRSVCLIFRSSSSTALQDSAKMKSALVFLALVAVAQGVPLLRAFDGRIVNGEDAGVGEIPYQVSLQRTRDNFHFCGGSVLNKHYVITAAHCVEGTAADSIKVIAGTTNLNEPQSVHSVVSIIVHAKYDAANSLINDITLLKVSTDFIFSATISPVPLPEKSAEVSAGSVAVVSGWGHLTEGGSSPKYLQRVDLEIADQSYCNVMYSSVGYLIHGTHICANDQAISSGSCHGDSGGPLTVDGKLVGLVSWAQGCASRIFPTVYTRVPEYIDWIESHAV